MIRVGLTVPQCSCSNHCESSFSCSVTTEHHHGKIGWNQSPQCLESCSIQLVGYILKQKVRNHISPKIHDMSFSVLHTLHQSLCQIYRIHKGLAKILNTDVINTTYIISYVCSINMFWLHRRAFPSNRFVGAFTGNSFKWHLAFSKLLLNLARCFLFQGISNNWLKVHTT